MDEITMTDVVKELDWIGNRHTRGVVMLTTVLVSFPFLLFLDLILTIADCIEAIHTAWKEAP